MDDLLIKYILEEVTPEESDQVQQWLALNTANRAHFEKLHAAWQLAAQPSLQRATDTSQALQRLKQTLQTRETAPIKRSWPRVWAAATALVGIAGVALGAYVWLKPKANIKEQSPVVQPDTVQQQPVTIDTVLMAPPAPALHTDTLPFVKPHKKKRAAPVTPVQPTRPKKEAVHQPTDTTHVKKKHPTPVQRVKPVKKHKSAPKPATPQAAVKEPPIT
jgi:hypothetical protein